MRGTLRRLRNAADRLEELFMAGGLAAMTLIAFAQVVLRTAGGGLVWSLEATTYLFAWLVLVGMSYGVRTRAHIAVDLLAARLPARAARVLAIVTLALGLGYCAAMLYGSSVFVGRLIELGNYARDIPLPRWLLTAIMPLAFVLLGARLVEAGWRVLVPRPGQEPER
jgi:C4-dicarboxylate transporter, DctQ subunit